ncbi:DNA polymerase [Scheffersomyces xylosifermentans]|uniref:DNA polymerase n=1 Tax=Scheffersomyces xylosifermentans TaxID=1304137 RepID=UPI00315CB04B
MAVSKDHYYRLSSEVPQERIEAATSLLSELAEVNSKEDWQYALNRLVKGLITTKQSARFGFSMALVEVIRELIYRSEPEYEDITVESYLELVLKTTTLKAAMKGKEERSVLFGRLFGFQVLLNSQVLLDSKLVTDETTIFKFIGALIELSTLKSWLRETAIYTVCQFIKLLENESSEISPKVKSRVFLEILQCTNDQGFNLSTEGIAVYLSIPVSERSTLAEQIQNPKSNWKNGDPFAKGNLPTLAKALKDVEVINPEDDEDDNAENKKQNGKNKQQKGSWSPRIPFVWDLILANFNESSARVSEATDDTSKSQSKKRKKHSQSPSKKSKNEEDDNKISLKEFWKVVIDESLFSEKASHERKYWGFEIFIKFFTSGDLESIQYLFSPNLLRCLINQSAKQNRMLNKISIKALESIVEEAKVHPFKAPIAVAKLTDEGVGGCWNFDLVTKSRTVDNLLSVFGKQTEEQTNTHQEIVLIELRDILESKFKTALEEQNEDASMTDDTTETFKKSNDSILKWCLDKLLLLIRANKNMFNEQSGSSVKFVEDIIKMLIKYGFFAPKSSNRVSLNIRNICQDRLNSILADIINLRRIDKSTWSSYVIKYISKLETSSKYVSLTDFDEELTALKEETLKTLNSISELSKLTESASKRDQLYCFELMFSLVLVQLYMGDDETVQVINEIKVCYEETFVGKEDDSDPVDSSVVLTEIILSFVSRKSTLLKKFANTVWEFFLCGKDEVTGKSRLNESSLTLLYDVLYARENKQGQDNLFEGEGEFEVDSEDNEDEDENKDGEEKNSDSDNGTEDEDSPSESSDSEDEEESKEDLLTELDKETNIKLAKALGIPAAPSGEVKFEDLDSSEDDEYESDSMDDEQMMAMDDQLSKIFKERQSAISAMPNGNKRKVEVMEAREHMIFFKNRILDLLEIFNKIQPNSQLNLTAIKPLVTLINFTLDKNLGVKAHKLLKTRISKTKVTLEDFELYYTTEEEKKEYKDSLLQLIGEMQKTVSSTKSSNQAHTLACSQACITISKNLINLDESYLESVLDIYTSSLKEWALNPKSKLQASLFFDFINWINAKR